MKAVRQGSLGSRARQASGEGGSRKGSASRRTSGLEGAQAQSPAQPSPNISSWVPHETPLMFQPPLFHLKALSETALAVVSESASTPLLHLHLLLPLGAANDPEGKEGLAGLSLSLIEEGLRTCLRETLSGRPWTGRLEVQTGWDVSTVSLQLLGEPWRRAVDQLSNRQPAYTDLEHWRNLRISHQHQRRLSPGLTADDTLSRLLYKAAPAAQSLFGTEASLSGIQLSDIEAWYQRSQSRPGQAWIFCGPVTSDAVFLYLGNRLSGATTSLSSPKGSLGNPSSGALNSHSEALRESGIGLTYLVDFPSTAQAEIRLGTTTVPLDHPDFLGLQLLTHLLGGGFSSRLSLRLREEQGLAYSAFCRLESRRGPSLWMASAAVDLSRAGEAMNLLQEEVSRLREERIPAPELRAAQDSLIGLAQTSLQSGHGVASFLQHGAAHGFLGILDRRYDRDIRSLGPDFLQQLANRYFAPTRLAGVAVGPLSALESSLQRVGHGYEYKPFEAADLDATSLNRSRISGTFNPLREGQPPTPSRKEVN